MQTDNSNTDHTQRSNIVSPNKLDRTFGSSINRTLLGNDSLSEDTIKDGTDETIIRENTKFTREMKSLGHDAMTSPISVKSKYQVFVLFKLGAETYHYSLQNPVQNAILNKTISCFI